MNTAYTAYYNKPASHWFEAIPLGCGTRGAMVLCKCDKEEMLLNQDNFWSGLPGQNDFKEFFRYVGPARELIDVGKYAEANEFVMNHLTGDRVESYMPIGTITIDFGHENCVDYIRTLDLKNSLYTCNYTSAGINYYREGFVSHPHTVFAQKFTASENKLSFTVKTSNVTKYETYAENGYLKMKGYAPINNRYYDEDPVIYDNSPDADCVRFQSWIWVETDGEKTVCNDSLTVKDASYAIMYQVSDTSFIDWRSMPRKDPSIKCAQLMAQARLDGYEKVKADHIADYKKLFDRAEITLERNKNSDLPTDERLKAFADDMSDCELVSLYYNFGRYLVISTERSDALPSNLQGIWSWEEKADWASDFHLNINLEMNYWCVENANLSECRLSLLKWLKCLNEQGKETARNLHNSRGSCAYHMVDVWCRTTPSPGLPLWAYWPMGQAWIAMDIFDHYEYTQDKEFLAEYYDILKDNALFLYDWLIFDSELGYYVTSPSTSPENQFAYVDENGEKKLSGVSKATTCDLSITREIFCDFIKASEILGRDETLAASIAEKLELLFPYQIGEKGDLLEWFKDFEQTELGHRHLSHLLSLYPGDCINEYENPDIFKAIEKSVEIRLDNGSGYTGWSCAWVLVFLAKFRNTARICEYFKRLFRDSTSPNLLDLHPPKIFQIDGNFGATAAIGELFVQSNGNVIEICPCIPDFMKSGSFKGIRAKGGITVNGEFENGVLKNAEIIPDIDGKYYFRYKDTEKFVTAKAGETVKIF